MPDVAYAIIGGGVIGRAIALAIEQRGLAGDVVVIERCPQDRTENQSSRNSGVIHAGIYYRKAERPLKARLCVEGNELLYEFCREHRVPHAKTGKLVVATDAREEGYLHGIANIARENDVPGVRMIGADEVRSMEPNIRATAALYAPSSGVVDAAAYLAALRRASSAHNLFATEVVGIADRGDEFEIQPHCAGKTEAFTVRWVISAAGDRGDDIARLLDPTSEVRLVPARGEAAKFYSGKRADLALGGRNIYPVPSGYYPDGTRAEVSYDEFQRLLGEGSITETVGVHLTPTLDDEGCIAKTTTIGPAIRAGIEIDDLASGLYPPEYFHKGVSEFFPSVRVTDIELHQAGIQSRMQGQLDWHLAKDKRHPRFIHALGIDSPGMTGSLAIGRYVVGELLATPA
ncbi:MAG: FAD-dependent oxidoreductase [Myxococcales bacterium]|nr:FAD-dependent oxidoreductase [Myxococcales bacterium]